MSDTNRGKYQEKIIYVLKYSDKYNEVRDLIVINGQPFYQSTGGSSSAEKKEPGNHFYSRLLNLC